MVLALFIITVTLNIDLGRTEMAPETTIRSDNHTYLDVYSSAISKAHYSPWSCIYRIEPGYRCLSCKSALHCFPGNFALLIQCAGLFPFCRNGYCSRSQEDGCNENVNALSLDDGHEATVPSYVSNTNYVKNKTEDLANGTLSPKTVITEVNEPGPKELFKKVALVGNGEDNI